MSVLLGMQPQSEHSPPASPGVQRPAAALGSQLVLPGRPGLLKALARRDGKAGILPAVLASRNRHHTPYWGVAVFLVAAAALVVAAGGQEQRLVLFYAVAVFIAFWCGLASMTRFFRRDRWPWLTGISIAGGLAVGVTLGADLARGYPIVSFVGACALADSPVNGDTASEDPGRWSGS